MTDVSRFLERWLGCAAVLAGLIAIGGCSPESKKSGGKSTSGAAAPVVSESPATSEADEAAVRAAFEGYRQALLSSNGEAAVSLVDSQTLRWYQESRDDALNAGADELKQRDFMRRFTVLRIRLEFSKSQIEEMDGRTFFVYAIQNGWISKGSVQNLDRLHSVEFTDGRMARATVPAAPKMPLFYFMKEDGAWKVALWKTFPLIESALVGAIKQQGLTEEEFIVQSFGAVSENEINSEIYQQLLASPRE